MAAVPELPERYKKEGRLYQDEEIDERQWTAPVMDGTRSRSPAAEAMRPSGIRAFSIWPPKCPSGISWLTPRLQRPNANVIAVKEGNENSDKIKALVSAT